MLTASPNKSQSASSIMRGLEHAAELDHDAVAGVVDDPAAVDLDGSA
jgi:hypothetical protein